MTTIVLAVAESHLRRALNSAIRSGLRIVAGTPYTYEGQRMVGCCLLGAARLDARCTAEVLPRLPQGAQGALVDGFDGRALDLSLDEGLGGWHALGARLRKAYGVRG